jgi:hypothetical protein
MVTNERIEFQAGLQPVPIFFCFQCSPEGGEVPNGVKAKSTTNEKEVGKGTNSK